MVGILQIIDNIRMVIILQEVFFYFDDSGTFHRNEQSGYFVYAGFVFLDKKTADEAKHKYINANKKIRQALGRTDELKACSLEIKHRRALFNSVREYDSLAVVVDINRIYDYILDNKKSRCRYKDYVLKRCIKNKLKRLIADGILSTDEDISITIYIDEQLTATNGYYDLRDSIREELQYGIVNFDYSVIHHHLFDSNVIVNIHYCDSSNNYLIQACDILANRIWNSYREKNTELRKISNHYTLTIP
jgi:hypothetical protein